MPKLYICKRVNLYFCSLYCNTMAQKDPVCNMMVDEKKTLHILEVSGKKSTYVLHNVKVSLTRTLANMDTKQGTNARKDLIKS